MARKMFTQKIRVLHYMSVNGSITPFEAFEELGITKLATVISDLRLKQGIEIIKTKCVGINRYGEQCRYMQYSLPEGEEQNDEQQ